MLNGEAIRLDGAIRMAPLSRTKETPALRGPESGT